MDSHGFKVEAKIASDLVIKLLIQINRNIKNPMRISIKLHKESDRTK